MTHFPTKSNLGSSDKVKSLSGGERERRREREKERKGGGGVERGQSLSLKLHHSVEQSSPLFMLEQLVKGELGGGEWKRENIIRERGREEEKCNMHHMECFVVEG